MIWTLAVSFVACWLIGAVQQGLHWFFEDNEGAREVAGLTLFVVTWLLYWVLTEVGAAIGKAV